MQQMNAPRVKNKNKDSTKLPDSARANYARKLKKDRTAQKKRSKKRAKFCEVCKRRRARRFSGTNAQIDVPPPVECLRISQCGYGHEQQRAECRHHDSKAGAWVMRNKRFFFLKGFFLDLNKKQMCGQCLKKLASLQTLLWRAERSDLLCQGTTQVRAATDTVLIARPPMRSLRSTPAHPAVKPAKKPRVPTSKRCATDARNVLGPSPT